VPEPATGVATNTVEVRFTGGMLALNRLLMTLQNKRMPVAGFTLGRDGEGMRATILLDCPPESALRYTALISALEDVSEAGPAPTMEVALVETASDWRTAAEGAGIQARCVYRLSRRWHKGFGPAGNSGPSGERGLDGAGIP
jgi:hypothetical protein